MFSILRIQKLKNRQQISAAVAHNLRLMNVPNSDESKQHLNKNFLAKNYGDLVGKMEQLFFDKNIKPRKDSVQAVEVLLTASPEFFINQETGEQDQELIEQWLKANQNFALSEFGKQNLLQFTLHMDETTPHIHLIFTPITKNNKLSMKELYGGKAKLSALQSRYAKAMKPFGLKRGKENSKAKHTTVKEFYALVNKLKSLNSDQMQEMAELLDQFDEENELEIGMNNMLMLKNLLKHAKKP
jgi:hypothetical protein